MPRTSANDYLALITSWHRGKPNFAAAVAATVQPFVDISAFIAGLPEAFDLDVAVGKQLDILGEWIGRTRNIIEKPQSLWFSLDDNKRGLDQGYLFQQVADQPDFIEKLDDDDYRRLLRAKIKANNLDGKRESLQAVIDAYFPEVATYVFVQDNCDMSIFIGVSGHIPAPINLVILSKGYLPLSPAAVHTDFIVTSIEGAPLFGLDVGNQYVSGPDIGAVGVPPDYALAHFY